MGTHDIHAVFTGTVGVFNDSASGHITQTVSQKTIEGRFTADSKVYDGNVSATVLTRTLIAVEATDVVSLIGGTATFDTASVAGGKTVTLVGVSITGADAFNYTLLSSTITDTATINKAEATVGFTGTYDGAAHSAIATGVLGEILSGLSGPTVDRCCRRTLTSAPTWTIGGSLMSRGTITMPPGPSPSGPPPPLRSPRPT